MTPRDPALAASLLDVLFDEPGVGRCLVGIDGTVLRVNAEWQRSTGLSQDQVLGANLIDLFPEARDMALDLHARARAGHEVAVPRHSQVVAGRETWWEGSIHPIPAQGGTALLITAREITAAGEVDRPSGTAEDNQQEVALQEKLELIDAITHSTDDVIYAKDGLGRFRFANPAALALIGKPLDQVLGRTDAQLLEDPAAARQVMENDRRIMERGAAMEMEESVPLPDGTQRVWLSRKVPYRDDQGRVIGLLGISRDITERKRVEAERDTLAQQRQLALDAAHMGWWHHDPISRVTWYDKRFTEIFGIQGRQLTMGDIIHLFDPADRSRVRAAVDAAYDPAQAKPYAVEYRINRPDGELRWVEAHGLAVFEGEGSARRVIGFGGTAADITKRKKAEQALRDSQQLLQSTMDHLPSVIVYKDRDGRFLNVNQAVEKALGLPQALILGKTVYDLIPRQSADLLRQRDLQVMASRQAVQHERAMALPSGTRHYLETSFPLIDAEGQVYGTGNISHDITDRKQAEAAVHAVNEQLREAHRHKDEFLATLAHELRNPLAPILTSVELIRLRNPDDDVVRRSGAIIARQTVHLTRLVDDLLDVSRITMGTIQLRLETLDLGEIARGAVEAVRPQLDAAGLALELQASQPSPAVRGDATRLAQCLTNLLGNAIKFTGTGGRIGLRLAQEGPMAVIEVSDSGTGIAPANLERIFEMFVQEHPSGWLGNTGLGIGLALTRQLVTLHGGTVHAASGGQGQGSTFRIELPALGATAAGPDAAQAEPAANDDAARVLVVDDNFDAADTMGAMLEMRGFHVTIEYSGEAAVRAVEQQGPQAVLLDIGLPGIDGYEACRRIRRSSRVSQPVVIALTGWGQAKDREMAAAAGFDAHLTKPAEPDQVVALLKQRLATAG
ncbi:MAG TPA: PAS domain-containing protein [Burkholderiaceae bacterium]|nr:PAS domain-containing protein [Burkholderiaceae bacterium]